jgi:hypothetical protein
MVGCLGPDRHGRPVPARSTPETKLGGPFAATTSRFLRRVPAIRTWLAFGTSAAVRIWGATAYRHRRSNLWRRIWRVKQRASH